MGIQPWAKLLAAGQTCRADLDAQRPTITGLNPGSRHSMAGGLESAAMLAPERLGLEQPQQGPQTAGLGSGPKPRNVAYVVSLRLSASILLRAQLTLFHITIEPCLHTLYIGTMALISPGCTVG